MPIVIGVAPCHKMLDYEESVRRAGAEPHVIERDWSSEDVVRRFDGLLLAGGGDVDPRFFGEEPHPTYHPAEPGRDEHEMELIRAALACDLPVLAICRGAQVLNVACGGTLVQDIPSDVEHPLPHNVEKAPSAIAHEVWLSKDSILWRLMQEQLEGDTLQVNSRHHQAVKDVARGFIVSGTAPDGVIEAIEHESGSFCVGVQWHPENFWRTGEFRSLFEGFVNAARARS